MVDIEPLILGDRENKCYLFAQKYPLKIYSPMDIIEPIIKTQKKPRQTRLHLAGVVGFEPTTFGFGDQRSTTELYSYT